MIGSMTLATGGLMTASSLVLSPANADPVLCGVPTGTGLQQNLNTTLGCDVVEGTSLMSGYLSDNGLQPGQVVTLEDAYEGLSSHLFYYGTYILTLNCQSGTPSAASTTYSITQGTGDYPLVPPTVTTGALPSVTADSSGNIVCAYTLAVQYAPSGHLNSSKSDLWIVAGGSGNTATASVKPPVLSPSDPGDNGSTTTTPTTDPDSTTTTPTTDPGSTTTTPTTDPGSTTTTPTTDPGNKDNTPTTDPGNKDDTPTTDPGSTTTTPTTDPGNKDNTTTTSPTTAPPLQTATVSDPTNGPTHVYDPVVTDPGAPASSTPSAPTAGDPANATVFNPRGLTALAFTGSNTGELAAIGLMLILFGGLVLGVSRRWVKSRAR